MTGGGAHSVATVELDFRSLSLWKRVKLAIAVLMGAAPKGLLPCEVHYRALGYVDSIDLSFSFDSETTRPN
jgi:hypothetical protein